VHITYFRPIGVLFVAEMSSIPHLKLTLIQVQWDLRGSREWALLYGLSNPNLGVNSMSSNGFVPENKSFILKIQNLQMLEWDSHFEHEMIVLCQGRADYCGLLLVLHMLGFLQHTA